jgi:HlyD family secretion protein
VLGAVTALALYYAIHERPVEVTAAKVTKGPVEQTVAAIASGTVMPARKSMVAAGTLGTISKVDVEEGQRVQEGDLLVELSHGELDAQLQLAEANLKVGQSRLEQAKLGADIYKDISATKLRQASAQSDQSRVEYDRIKALSAEKAVSQSNLDQAALALRVTQETKTAAEASQRENQVREEEIHSAEAVIEQLEAAVAVAKAARDRAFVRAPFAGVVADKVLEVGEAVAMGLPLLHLVQDNEIYVEAPFDEANLAQIAVGQKVRIEIDAYPNQEFPGEVTYIAPVVAVNRDLSRTVSVKVRVTDGAGKFITGMSADVTVVAEKKDSVLFVSTESLIRDEAVYLIEDGRVVRRPVTIGIGNWENREITGGLKEGDTIITSVSVKELQDGVKVKIVDQLEQ